MKRYLLFIALLGLGFGACKEDSVAPTEQLQEEKINKRADLTTPQEMVVFEQRVNACADTYLQDYYANGDNPTGRIKFKRCLSQIPPVTPTGPTNDPYSGVGGPAAHEPNGDFNRARTFQELVELAGIKSSTTTQDSVTRFVNYYKNVDLIVRGVPGHSMSELNQQLSYALQNGLGKYIFTIAEGIAYPNRGMSYLLSIDQGSFKVPLHWAEYGFNLFAPLDFGSVTIPEL